MGTSYHITVIGDSAAKVGELAEHVQQRLDQLDGIFSTYKEDSELSNLNGAAVGVKVPVSEEMHAVLQLSLDIYDKTGGAFNPAIGPLVDLWGFGPEKTGETLPSADQISQRMAMVDFSQLVIDLEKMAATRKAALRIDLSAVAKGYAVDQIAELLEWAGYQHYLVEVGGELRLSGANQQGKPWRIGVEQPSLGHEGAQKVLELSGVGLATSGDYRNYIDREGVRYSHTIDPVTGRPVVNQLASVTVIHSSAAVADALATAFMVMGQSAAQEFANGEDLAAYFIVKGNDGFSESQSVAFDRYLNNTGSVEQH